jgi:hypothetical protein
MIGEDDGMPVHPRLAGRYAKLMATLACRVLCFPDLREQQGAIHGAEIQS